MALALCLCEFPVFHISLLVTFVSEIHAPSGSVMVMSLWSSVLCFWIINFLDFIVIYSF